MKASQIYAVIVAVLFAPAAFALGGQYNLFNPTPEKLMRPLSPDRPGFTDSPYTVDAGHYQFEPSILTGLWDNSGGTRTSGFTFMSMNAKAGIWDDLDLQLLFDLYTARRTKSDGETSRADGFGDVTLRAKFNLWGNDGQSDSVFGVIPFIKLPTADDSLGNNHVEGGVSLPFAHCLPHQCGFGGIVKMNMVRNSANDGNRVDFTITGAVSRNITGPLNGCVEFASIFTTEDHTPWLGFIHPSLNYLIHKDLSIDCGVILGISSAAPDVQPFIGFSWRY